MQRRKCLPKCWVAGDHKDLQEPNIFFPWPQHVNLTKNVFIVLNAQVLLHFGVSAIRLYLCHRLAKQSGELSLGKIAKQSHSVRQNYV
jgi:hypothetical protein